ncbi:class A beta-lactamase [Sphingomonas baiyangensis]|uniref:Beta-lactamase n=1 Tax=Sphingomonas baiyangensis TaxID=2572576 RepID=A0A4U1L365_9SPHN|nr:class A beta-lactamase [Sphingomonas baiyangensis]TKD50914.1 class A beta-lactamase [Sphingomonas baiyangensis]
MPDRRMMIAGALAAMLAPRVSARQADGALEALRRRADVRLGLAVHDTGTGRRLTIDGMGRYAMCSTFKAPLAAAVLARVDAGRLRLDQPVRFGDGDLLDYAPAVRARRAEGRMTVAELCEAAVVLSDNSAANLLLPLIGGPAGLTRWFRSMGDGVSRLDRTEPTFNDVRGDETRDTTSSLAMAATLERMLVGDVLSSASRARRIEWMVASRTGASRLRAGLPADWRAGDKTGTSGDGWFNDIAIIWPPQRKPIVVACYLDAPGADTAVADAVHADIGAQIGHLFA